MVTQIDHIEIIVNDVEEYMRFFQLMGFKLLKQTGHHGGSAELQLPGPNQPIIEIHKVTGEENIGINHLAMRVNDVHAAYELFKENNLNIAREPKYVEVTGRTNMNMRDPDGWRIQICDQKRAEPVGED